MFSSKLPPFRIFYDNGEEYHVLKNEVFTDGVYYFETENPSPKIIDAGAHIGLATLYFKKVYPAARVVAIEPNPETFPLLEKNVFENQLDGVELHQVTLAAGAGEAEFFLDSSSHQWWSTSGFSPRAWNGAQTTQSLLVKTEPLATFLDEPIDFLKMDIEGAEQEVLLATGEKIEQVRHLLLEFHPTSHQSLPKLVEFLRLHGFKVTLWQNGKEVEMRKVKGLVYIEALFSKYRNRD